MRGDMGESKIEASRIGRALVSRWAWPPLMAILFMVLTTIVLGQQKPQFEARLVIVEKSAEGRPGFGMNGVLGSTLLGSLAEGGAPTSYDKFVILLASEDVALRIWRDGELMSQLFPHYWDPTSRKWQRPDGFGAQLRGLINRAFGLPAWSEPGVEPVVGLLQKHLRIVPSDNGRFTSIAFRHEHPDVATKVLRLVVARADDLVRARDRAAAVENIRFLRGRLQSEPLAEIREVLAEQLAREYARATAVSSTGSYSYDIQREIYTSPVPVSPRPVLSLALTMLAGLILGSVIAVLAGIWRQDRTRVTA